MARKRRRTRLNVGSIARGEIPVVMTDEGEKLLFRDERNGGIHISAATHRTSDDVFTQLDEHTQSDVSCYLACKQKYVLQYLMRLRKRGINIPFLIGSAFHEAMDVFLDPDIKEDSKARLAITAIDALFDEQLEKSDLLAPADTDKLEHSRATAHACTQAWFIIHGDTAATWNLVASEFSRRGIEGDGSQADLLRDQMAGKIDGIVEVNYGADYPASVDGIPDWKRMLLEHKTTSRLAYHDPAGLILNLQALWYIVMETVKAPNVTTDGFMYNVVQKPKHRMSEAGFDDLVNRMVEAMIAAPEKYFCFTPVLVDRETIARHSKNFEIIVTEINNLTPDQVTMNLTSCNRYNGCEYRPLCEQLADASNPASVMQLAAISQFEIREHAHPELEDDKD